MANILGDLARGGLRGSGILNNILKFQQINQQQAGLEQAKQQQQQQANLQNTLGNLRRLEVLGTQGGTPEQFAAMLQQNITNAQQSGGNPADSVRALQILQSEGVQGLQNNLAQGRAVFEQQGVLNPLNTGAGAKIQTATNIPGLGSQITLEDGTTRLVELTPEEQQAFQDLDAQDKQASLGFLAEKAELETGAITKREQNKQKLKISQGFRQQASEAQKMLRKVDAARKAIADINTGKSAQFKSTVGKFLPGVVDASKEQFAEAVLKDLVFAPLGEFKGALSDSEREFAESTVANLGYSREANMMLLDNLENNLRDKIQAQKNFAKFKADGGDPLDFIPNVTTLDERLGPITQAPQDVVPAAIARQQPVQVQEFTSPSGISFTVE